VTPFRGFVREATRRKLGTKITILYSVRTTKDIIFNDEFRQLEAENPNFSFHVTCTRLPAGDPWIGRCGRIDATWIQKHVGNVTDTVFYACGPNELVENTQKLVVNEMGIPKGQMLVEKWG
jgi:Na+-transporting NADH:ubiquinone oxidoreductase subunit F